MSRPFEPGTPAPWETDADHGSSAGYSTYRNQYGDSSGHTDRATGYGSYGYGGAAYAATSTTVADRPHSDDYADHADEYADEAYPDYPDEGYYAYDEPIDRRWIWVAGVAGAILLVAVICTVIILGGGDSGPVTATVTPSAPTTSAIASPSATPSAAAPRIAPVAPPTASLAPETVTTVTPSATPTAMAPQPEAVPPAEAAAPPAAGQTVTYRITGNRPLLDLVTVIYTDGQGALQTELNVALPWAKTVTLDPGVTLSSVTATSVTGQLNCSITDGSGAPVAAQNNNTMITSCTK